MRFITPKEQKEILAIKKEAQIITLQTKINDKLKLGHHIVILNQNEEHLLSYIEEDLRNSGWEIKKDKITAGSCNGKVIIDRNNLRYIISPIEEAK